MIKRLHHLNFIVRDLEQSMPAFTTLLGTGAGKVESLPERGVRLVRFRVGETWLILVQPTDPDGVPARYLEQHGEGFFLASFQVDSLEAALDQLGAEGIPAIDPEPRQGLDDWQVVDLETEPFSGVQVQLVHSGDRR